MSAKLEELYTSLNKLSVVVFDILSESQYRSENFYFFCDDHKSFQLIIYFQRLNTSHSFLQILTCSGKTVVLVLSQKIVLIIKKIKNCTYTFAQSGLLNNILHDPSMANRNLL